MHTQEINDAANALIEKHGYWQEVPGHPMSDWQDEVYSGDTMLGYHHWCAAREEWGDDE